MAQSLVVSVNKNPFLDANIPFTTILDWTSATGGTVSLPIASTWAAQLALKNPSTPAPTKVQGIIRSVETVPGANGDLTTNLPTSYTLTILDKYGLDILEGNFATRSASVAEKKCPTQKLIIDSELTFTIASAGDGKQGRVIIEWEDQGYAHQ